MLDSSSSDGASVDGVTEDPGATLDSAGPKRSFGEKSEKQLGDRKSSARRRVVRAERSFYTFHHCTKNTPDWWDARTSFAPFTPFARTERRAVLGVASGYRRDSLGRERR